MKSLPGIVFVLLTIAVNAQQVDVNRLVVQFHSDPCPKYMQGDVSSIGNSSADAVNRQYNGQHIVKHSAGRKTNKFFFTIEFATASDLKSALADYMKNPAVEFAEFDHSGSAHGTQVTAPNDAFYNFQWGLYNDGTFGPNAVAGCDIDMENAWAITTGSSSLVVGTIDSGLKLDHPEVSGRLWTNAGEIPGNSIDDDANGFVDDMNGWDFANTDNSPFDDFGHGTNVTGIIGATGNNSIGYAGVDWNSRLMTMKGLSANGNGFYTWWVDAVYYAVDNGVDVLNMSLGGTTNSILLQNAIDYALNNNVTVCASMGNDDSLFVCYPAGFPGVIAVGSTDPNDTRTSPFFWSTTSGSNYGAHISVVAPGNLMYGLDHNSNTFYYTQWGETSQASPHAAGLAALLLSIDPSLTPAQIKATIENTAEDQVGLASEDVAGWDQYYGHGRINAYAAMLATSIGTEFSDGFNVSIYPSPATTGINFSCGDKGMKSFTIHDVSGKVIISEALNGARSHYFNCEMLKPGIYFLSIGVGEEQRVTRFVVSE